MRNFKRMLWLHVTALLMLFDSQASAQTTHHAQLTLQLGHTFIVSCVTFSPDGQYVLTSGTDTAPRLWDETSGKELRRFEAGRGGMYTSLAVSPDGRRVIAGALSGSLSYGISARARSCKGSILNPKTTTTE